MMIVKRLIAVTEELIKGDKKSQQGCHIHNYCMHSRIINEKIGYSQSQGEKPQKNDQIIYHYGIMYQVFY